MFSFPLDKMVGGILYEHGHRLIASTVGFLTVILAIWTWRVDPRRWMGKLGFTALGAVILQGLLGGLTVLLLLPAPVSIGHAGLAPLFFCSTIAIALFTSPGWRSSAATADDRSLRARAITTTCLVYLQILLGATMRHGKAGLAIPDFPLAFGALIPPYWNAGIAMHYAHRVGAVAVLLAVLMTTARVWTAHRTDRRLRRPALLLVSLVLVQGTLGAFVVWSGLQPVINTAHVANGALVLGTSLVLALRTCRPQFADFPVPGHLGASAPRHPDTPGSRHLGTGTGAGAGTYDTGAVSGARP
ncbi:MAG: COX15/CtaA family protein [Acidobacteria bacterium]|nr:COX15/CtaA family protein [Acidobacteriota bacterium]